MISVLIGIMEATRSDTNHFDSLPSPSAANGIVKIETKKNVDKNKSNHGNDHKHNRKNRNGDDRDDRDYHANKRPRAVDNFSQDEPIYDIKVNRKSASSAKWSDDGHYLEISQMKGNLFRYQGLTKNSKETSDIVNKISPEHLEICTKKPEIYLNSIKNAGSVFLGNYSPEAIGDYIAGPNHVLPTSGTAKFSSGLSVYDFLKRQSIIKITKSGIERLGSSVINLAKYENLQGHANSIKIRIK